MKNIIIIPKLDTKEVNLAKGMNYKGSRVIGDPQNFAKYYYNQGADEMIYFIKLYQRVLVLNMQVWKIKLMVFIFIWLIYNLV